jgi:hypothetical protein
MPPRQWLPLNPGTIVGTPARLPAPNPFSINWPKAQFANPSMVGSYVRLAPQKPVPASERVGAGPMFWSWAQFGTGKEQMPRFAPNAHQRPPEVLYSGPDADLTPVAPAKHDMNALACCAVALAGFVLAKKLKSS